VRPCCARQLRTDVRRTEHTSNKISDIQCPPTLNISVEIWAAPQLLKTISELKLPDGGDGEEVEDAEGRRPKTKI
jgi:hypothetical protein